MAIPSGTKFVGIASTVPTPENRSSQNNGFQEVYTIDQIVADAQAYDNSTSGLTATNTQDAIDELVANPSTGYTETIVNISSAEILAADTKTLFSIPNGSTLRSLEVFAVYTEGSISYTPGGLGDYFLIKDYNNGDELIRIHKDIFTWWVTEGVPVVNNYVWNSNMIDNGTPISSIVGGHLTGTADNEIVLGMNSLILSDGNGTLDLHCKYSLITLGA